MALCRGQHVHSMVFTIHQLHQLWHKIFHRTAHIFIDTFPAKVIPSVVLLALNATSSTFFLTPASARLFPTIPSIVVNDYDTKSCGTKDADRSIIHINVAL